MFASMRDGIVGACTAAYDHRPVTRSWPCSSRLYDAVVSLFMLA